MDEADTGWENLQVAVFGSGCARRREDSEPYGKPWGR
jgi:hypothetical protein